MNKIFNLILLSFFLPLCSFASGWDTTYRQIESNIKVPFFKNKSYVITKFGASLKADAAKNQAAINKAIATCSAKGGGRVVVPKGTWKTGGIRLRSNVNLVVEDGATLLFVFDTNLYPLVRTRWEGMDCWNYQPLIYAYQCENIAITGKGTIDGGAENGVWWNFTGLARFGWKEGQEKNRTSRPQLLKMVHEQTPIDQRRFGKGCGLRPQLVNLVECKNILIEGVTMLRSPFWVMHPLLSKNITVRNVKVWNEGPNCDGCDPESCEDVLIEGCNFHTGDDCIAIKSGRNEDGRKPGMASRNIIVRNCEMEDGHGGVVVGSEIGGGCNNVYVENCKMDSPNLDRVIRIKTNSCRGGVTENIYARNIEVGQCGSEVLKINLKYDPKEVYGRGHNPIVRNVYLENITCKKSKYGVNIVALEDAPNVYNIHVNNCNFTGVTTSPVIVSGWTHDLDFKGLVVNGKPVAE